MTIKQYLENFEECDTFGHILSTAYAVLTGLQSGTLAKEDMESSLCHKYRLHLILFTRYGIMFEDFKERVRICMEEFKDDFMDIYYTKYEVKE